MLKLKITIIEDKKMDCIESLKWYESFGKINEDGAMEIKQDSVMKLFQSMLADELLLASISSKPILPERSKGRALRLALARWLKYKKYQRSTDDGKLNAFKEAFLIEATKILDQERDYRVLAFINIDSSSLPKDKNFQFCDGYIKIVSWSQVDDFELKNVYDFFALQSQLKGISKLAYIEQEKTIFLKRSVFTPFLVYLSSFSPHEALRLGIEILDMLRVCYNFSSASKPTIQYGRFEPIGKFLPSPFYAVYTAEDTKLLDFIYPFDQYIYWKKEEIPLDEIDATDFLFSMLNNPDKGLSKLFKKILYLYQQALDQVAPRSAYLALWQVAEACVLDKPSHPTKVNSRLANIMGVNQELFYRGLSLIRDKRNELVHTGYYPNESELLFSLQLFVNIALKRLLLLAEQLKNEQELEEYLTHLPMDNTKLAREKKAIEIILSLR